MTAEHASLEAVAQRRVGNMFQAPDLRRAGLVDVQIDFEPARRGHLEQAVELEVDGGGHIAARRGDSAHDAAVPLDDIGDAAELGLVRHGDFGREQGDGLQRDAILPFFARFGEDREGDRRLLAIGIDMRADGARAVCVGAAQRELHAFADVFGGPPRLAVFDDSLARAQDRTVFVLDSGPDMTLVQMRVHFDEARQNDSIAQVDGRQIAGGIGNSSRCAQHRHSTAVDDDLAGRHAVGVRVTGKRRREVYRHTRVDDAKRFTLRRGDKRLRLAGVRIGRGAR